MEELDFLRVTDVLEKYAKQNKVALLIMTPGWCNSTEDKKQEIFDYYNGKISREIMLLVSGASQKIVELRDYDEARFQVLSTFPPYEAISDMGDEYFVKCEIIDENGTYCWSNKIDT